MIRRWPLASAVGSGMTTYTFRISSHSAPSFRRQITKPVSFALVIVQYALYAELFPADPMGLVPVYFRRVHRTIPQDDSGPSLQFAPPPTPECPAQPRAFTYRWTARDDLDLGNLGDQLEIHRARVRSSSSQIASRCTH